MIAELRALVGYLDPRGRSDRRELLIIAILLIGAEAWLMLLTGLTEADWPIATILTKIFVLTIGGIAMIRRLHDMNLSGWWLPAGFAGALLWTFASCGAAMLIGGFEALQPGTTSSMVLLGAAMLPPLAATFFLHFAPGDVEPNRFGAPAPDAADAFVLPFRDKARGSGPSHANA